MPATQRRWTAAAVRALPDDGKRYELIDGELLVTPSPRLRHQDVVGELYHLLRLYLKLERMGKAFMSPADIELEPDTIVQPDVFVVPLIAGKPPMEWPEVGRLLLACEVLSPSTARYDRVTKRRFFGRTAVDEYWVVDTEGELFERSRHGEELVEVLADELTWHPAGAGNAFTIDVADFFRSLRGG